MEINIQINLRVDFYPIYLTIKKYLNNENIQVKKEIHDGVDPNSCRL